MRKIVLQNVQLSYPALIEPDAFGNQEPRYKATLIFTDRTNVEEFEAAIEAELQDEFGSDRPHESRLRLPVKSGDTKFDSNNQVRPEFAGKKFAVAKSKHKPLLVGPNPAIAADESMVFPGAEANVVVQVSAYNTSFGVGVTTYLGSVQLTGKGESFLGGSNDMPENEFADLT